MRERRKYQNRERDGSYKALGHIGTLFHSLNRSFNSASEQGTPASFSSDLARLGHPSLLGRIFRVVGWEGRDYTAGQLLAIGKHDFYDAPDGLAISDRYHSHGNFIPGLE